MLPISFFLFHSPKNKQSIKREEHIRITKRDSMTKNQPFFMATDICMYKKGRKKKRRTLKMLKKGRKKHRKKKTSKISLYAVE
jgi:hypothetical protein